MMKKMSLCTLLLFMCDFVVGQCSFAVIDDADGYTNLRNGEKEIVAKVYEDDILFIYDSVDEQYKEVLAFWNMPDKFTRYGMQEEGEYCNSCEQNILIHKSRVKKLDDLPQLKRIEVGENKALFYDKEITIEIITGAIDKTKRNIELGPMGYEFPIMIDGYKMHGIDWPLSERDTEVKSINYMINGVAHSFEAKHLRGFLNLSGEYLWVARGKNNTIYIYGSGGDGSGGYCALWAIKDGEIKSAIAFISF